jgi:hypothetical protein
MPVSPARHANAARRIVFRCPCCGRESSYLYLAPCDLCGRRVCPACLKNLGEPRWLDSLPAGTYCKTCRGKGVTQ